MYSMSAICALRISEADLQKAVAVAAVAERTRMGIDVQNASVRVATASGIEGRHRASGMTQKAIGRNGRRTQKRRNKRWRS
jgi:hypothetical protein